VTSKYHARRVLRGTQTERRAYDTDLLQEGAIWLESSSTDGSTDAPQVYVWTGASGAWMRLAATDLIRFGEITDNDEDVAGYGMLVYFSGGPSFSAGGWDSDNSDPIWMARYNAASDDSELHINIGDNGEWDDRIEIGYTSGGTWYPVFYISSDGTVVFTQNSEPADACLVNSSFTFWLTDTPGATVLNVKAKDSGGTVRAATVNLS